MVRNENQSVASDTTGAEFKRSELGSEELATLNKTLQNFKITLLESEKDLLCELIHALRTIRFGSIVLTVHEGQLVEINKSIRIRRSRAAPKD